MQTSVAQILAEKPQVHRNPTNDVFRCAKRLRSVATLVDRLLAAVRTGDEVDEDNDYEAIHEAIFMAKPESIADRTREALALGGFVFPDYVDPNASYEADVRAWVEAFRRIRQEVDARRDAIAGNRMLYDHSTVEGIVEHINAIIAGVDTPRSARYSGRSQGGYPTIEVFDPRCGDEPIASILAKEIPAMIRNGGFVAWITKDLDAA